MIRLYYNLSNSSCKKAMQWFKDHDLPVIEKRVSKITRRDLLRSLELSETGFPTLLKSSHRCELEVKWKLETALSLSFNEAVNFILENTEILKVPLILDENKLVLGYNTETIRVFVPRVYRNVEIPRTNIDVF